MNVPKTKVTPAATESPVGAAIAHDSGLKHANGAAIYIDDIPEPADLLHLAFGTSAYAHATIAEMDLTRVKAAPRVHAVFTAKDIVGLNDVSPIAGDDPLFADGLASYHGQALFVVAAEDRDAAIAATKLADITYAELPPVLTIADARAADSLIEPAQTMARGDADTALANAPHRLSGTLAIGGQDHFYLEGQICQATPNEDGGVHIFSSTQNPSEVQEIVAKVLDVPSHAVVVEVRRMGGGFGGKETQSSLLAGAAALVAKKTGRPAKLRLDRDADMIMTGKRHDFETEYDIGFDDNGKIEGIKIDLSSRCGYSADLSLAINDRAMFHADNAYYLPNVTITSHRYKTNTVSNTAFRGFGGPQGMMVIERAIDDVALHFGKDPLEIRTLNAYGPAPRNITPYHQEVEDADALKMVPQLVEKADYKKRRQYIRAFNKANTIFKKGIALTPVKFGISFTTTHLNQAGALVHIYKDGSVLLNHGGTEMGQGLFVKVAQIVAAEFGIDLAQVRTNATVTDKVPNTSATAASSGSDINGLAAQRAARQIKERLVDFVAEANGCDRDAVHFVGNQVLAGGKQLAFKDVVHDAYLARISLSANGFYKTPKIHYDRSQHRGRPFYYFAYGAAVSEVIIDTLTGENRVLRTDILHDVGASLNPAIDLGQIEGGFVQGMGWLTTEELFFDDSGVLKTHAPSTYKIPACGDRPLELNAEIWSEGHNVEETIYRSKAVGEPPLMLAISVFAALTDAVAAVADYKVMPRLDAPATPERILAAVDDLHAAPAS